MYYTQLETLRIQRQELLKEASKYTRTPVVVSYGIYLTRRLQLANVGC